MLHPLSPAKALSLPQQPIGAGRRSGANFRRCLYQTPPKRKILVPVKSRELLPSSPWLQILFFLSDALDHPLSPHGLAVQGVRELGCVTVAALMTDPTLGASRHLTKGGRNS